MGDNVSVETVADGVAVVTLHQPPANFVNAALIGEIADGLDDAASAGHRVAVIASEGKHFCAGASLSGDEGPRGIRTGDGKHLYDHAIRLFEQPLPLVAAVQGAAVGAGLGLALSADFRVATPNSRFAANFATLGFHPGFGISETLPRVVGRQMATELLYTGRRIDGTEASRIGLCDRLVADEELMATATAFATEIAASAPLALRAIRQTQRAGLADAVREMMQHEKSEQERLMRTNDFREGVAATSERRPARFTGS